MNSFITTNYISEIIENSKSGPVVIFKYSNQCQTSERLKENLQRELEKNSIKTPIYIVTVQNQKSLSKSIEDFFEVKHESPQILVINKGKCESYASHHHIKVSDLLDRPI